MEVLSDSGYKWPYLKDVDERGAVLFNKLYDTVDLAKYVPKVVDVGCGYSPMAGYFDKAGWEILGVDSYLPAIEELGEKYPEHCWLHSTIDSFSTEDEEWVQGSVLLLLGLTKDMSLTDIDNIIFNVSPEVIVTDCNINKSTVTNWGTLVGKVGGHHEKYNTLQCLLWDNLYFRETWFVYEFGKYKRLASIWLNNG